jgi:hypothetical protein
MEGIMENFGLISSYARAQVKEDGVLVDVSAIAKEAGFQYPVFITRDLFDGYIDPAPQLQHENIASRLWETLTMLASTIKSTKNPGSRLWFTVAYQMYFDGKRSIQNVKLKSVVKPGFGSTKVITVMLPGED